MDAQKPEPFEGADLSPLDLRMGSDVAFLLQSIIDASDDLVFCKDREGVYLACNEAFACRFLGKEISDIIGHRDHDFVEKSLADFFRRNDEIVMGSGEARTVNEWVTYADGREVLLETKKFPLRDSSGEVVGIVGLSRDYTREHEVRRALQHREERLEGLAVAINHLILSQGEEYDHHISQFLKLLGQALRVDRAWILDFPVEKQTAESPSLHFWRRQANHPPLCEKELLPVCRTLDEGILADPFEEMPDVIRSYMEAQGIASVILAPVQSGTGPIACIAFEIFGEKRLWTESETSILRMAASGYSAALIRQKAERELQHALQVADEANQIKTEFLSMMNHEIRTPISGITAPAELLLETSLDSRQSRLASIILKSGHALAEIVNKILNLSSLLAGSVRIDSVAIHIESLLRQIIDQYRLQADEKSLTLRHSIDLDGHERVMGDIEKIRIILQQLTDNAIKFTEQGGISIEASLTETHAVGICNLIITVRDTGCGIESHKQSRIFEPFAQNDSSTRRKYNGAGLGLALSKRLCELLGGGLCLTSEPGKGSVFRLSLPVELDESATPAVDSLNLRIAIAEDNSLSAKVLSRLCRRLGCEVSVASDGLGLMELLAAGTYDVVLMDLNMPAMDGFAAAHAIRSGNRDLNKAVPIVAITGDSRIDTAHRCREAGMQDVLTKPITLAPLHASLVGVIRRPASPGKEN